MSDASCTEFTIPGGKPRRVLCVSCLLLLLAAQAVLSMRRKAVTVDELTYIAVGYYHLQTGDFQMNMTHPPLMKMLSAAPLLLLKPDLPPVKTDPAAWSLVGQWQYARSFMYDNRVDADRLLFFARLPVVMLALVLGIFVYRWASELGGEGGGLFALFLFSFSPNILAHARLATHDLGITAFMFIASFYFWRYMRRPAARPLILCGVFAGLALLTKSTAGFLAPIFALYVLLCVARRNGLGIHEGLPGVRRLGADCVRRRQLATAAISFCIIGAIVLAMLNVGYGFQGSFKPFEAASARSEASDMSVSGRMCRHLSRVPLPVPSPFVHMIKFQSRLTKKAEGDYFAGKTYVPKLWYLTLAAMALKTPLGVFPLFAAALVHLVKRARSCEAQWLFAAFVIVIVSLFCRIDGAHGQLRYVLPVYPFLHVLVGTLFCSKLVRARAGRAMVGLLAGWYMVSSLGAFPHYLAYFNELIGGPTQGYRYLVDSNLDWGQDLKGLKEYMDAKGIKKVALGYFGSADASYYGIEYDYLPSVGLAPKERGQLWWYEEGAGCAEPLDPPKGIVALSASLRANQSWMKDIFADCYARFRDRDPIDQVGHSILIYDVK